MKNIFYMLIASLMLGGCYSNTIESFSTFTFQLPILINSTYVNRNVPSVAADFSNLYKYSDYKDNQDRIKKARLLQFNGWIDTLVLEGGQPFDPLGNDDIEFEYVSYKLIFAKPKYGNKFSQDPNDFEIDTSIEEFEIARLNNVKVKDFYRSPLHIVDIPPDMSEKISQQLISSPYFYIATEYSKLKGQAGDSYHFPLIDARIDITIRLEVELY